MSLIHNILYRLKSFKLYLKNSTILAKLSGNVTRTFEVGSNTNEIFVQYHTDESGASKGFRITRNNGEFNNKVSIVYVMALLSTFFNRLWPSALVES